MNTKEQIEELLRKAPDTKIAVIGDLIIDEYWCGDVNRISPEAPVPVLNLENKVRSMGGAGNVYNNLKSLGVDVALYCNYPDTEKELWSTNESIFVNPYPCSRKVRMVAGNQQLLRVDVETPYNQIEWMQFKAFSWWRELTDRFDTYDIIVLSDYSKGVLSDGVINTILEFAQLNGKIIIADAKRDLNRYASPQVVIKCNKKEWDEARHSGFKFSDTVACKGYCITLGEGGLSLKYNNMFQPMKGYKVDIVDVCGAGDTVTAVLAAGMAAGMYPFTAAKLANLAAAEVCRHPGVVPITPDGLMISYERTSESINP